MVGKVVVCVLMLQFRYASPSHKTYWAQGEASCKVLKEWPVESDGRQLIKVDCTAALNKLRLTRHNMNDPFRWAIYGEDCF